MAISVEEFQQTSRDILGEVSRVIVGQEEVIRYVLTCVVLGRHALLEGVPGLGKTMLIRTLGDVLNLKFSRIQFTPDLMPADIVGTNIMEDSENGHREFRFQPGPVFANLILADEINRATPKTQSAMLEAMQEQMVTVADQSYRLEPPFFVMATQNPLEMEGTYPLPEAQLDRFLFKIDVRFPTEQELVSILARTTGVEEPTARTVTDGATVIAMGELARQVPVPTQVSEYVARLIVATQPQTGSPSKLVMNYVRYGSSPRGAQAIILGAKVWALLEGRFNVAYDDILAVAPAALRHRLLLNFEGQAEGITPDQVVADLLATVPRS
jgi:MoxR-like ATPase